MKQSFAAVVAIALTCTLSGCAGDGPTAELAAPSIRVLSSMGRQDTINAVPTQGLVVGLVGNFGGEPVTGTPLYFTSTDGMGFLGTGDIFFRQNAFSVADERGRATVILQMPGTAGKATVTISSPMFGIQTTAEFVVLPGAAKGVRVVPRDTLVEVGAVVPFQGTIIDRNGNPRNDPVSYEVVSGASTIDAATGRAIMNGTGVSLIRVRSTVPGSQLQGDATIGVAPPGVVLFSTSNGGLSQASISGTGLIQRGSGLAPSWRPGSNRFVANRNNGLVLVNADGAEEALATPGHFGATWPEWSSDDWIYFHTNVRRAFRIRPNGTGLEPLAADVSAEMPTPSPDGRSLAFRSNGSLAVLDLQTDAVRFVPGPVSVSGPRWSPDGQWIAFTAGAFTGTLMLVRPDGSDLHAVGQIDFDVGISWSPDSRWIVGSEYGRIAIVDLATGAMARTVLVGRYPAWQR